jgi:hypothetical protein
MYVGRYRDALSAFSAIETNDPRLWAWIYVKVAALGWVIEATRIEEQKPDRQTAIELAGEFVDVSDGDADELAARIWERDAASPLGWFNYARVLLHRDLPEEAMLSYLTAAVMSEGDVEAWVNVGLLAVNLEDEDLFAASAITGDRLNPNDYMEEFVRQVPPAHQRAAPPRGADHRCPGGDRSDHQRKRDGGEVTVGTYVRDLAGERLQPVQALCGGSARVSLTSPREARWRPRPALP